MDLPNVLRGYLGASTYELVHHRQRKYPNQADLVF